MIPRLHLVTDDDVLQQPDFITTASALLRALQHTTALHIRARALPASIIFQIVADLRAVAAQAGALLLVNDRVDVALSAHADGVHLGYRSLPIPAARVLMGERWIGYSAHSAEETAAAERDGADFVFAGTIYPTPSHPATRPGGLSLLERAVAAARGPVLAIGGVRTERVPELLRAGAHGVAVIRAVWAAPDPVHAAEEFARLLET